MIWEDNALLMVDTSLVASESGTSMVREEAYKHTDNPILHEASAGLYGGRRATIIQVSCVAREGGRFRMWYTHADDWYGRWVDCAYAESDDGLHFKPVKVPGGRGNQVVVTDRADVGLGGMMHDPADREWPYKRVVTRQRPVSEVNPAVLAKWPHLRKGGKCELVWGVARSRDGFGWELPRHDHNLLDADIEGPAIYRALDGGYVISNQMRHPISHLGGRKVKGWLTYDFERAHRVPDFVFTVPDHMVRTSRSFTGRDWPDIPWAQSHVGLIPARHGPTMMALHGYLYMCYGPNGVETYAQVADVGLAISDTGLWFQDVWPFRPFLRRGDMGRWDCGLVVQGPMLSHGGRTLIYYGSSQVGNAAGNPFRSGLAYFRRDGYGYRVLRVYRDYEAPKERLGVVTLKPQKLPARPAFSVNASHVTKTRTVRLELADERGRALRGYSFADCVPIAREGVRRKVGWRGGRVGAELGGRAVTIRAELHSPDCRYADQHSPRLYAVYTA